MCVRARLCVRVFVGVTSERTEVHAEETRPATDSSPPTPSHTCACLPLHAHASCPCPLWRSELSGVVGTASVRRLQRDVDPAKRLQYAQEDAELRQVGGLARDSGAAVPAAASGGAATLPEEGWEGGAPG